MVFIRNLIIGFLATAQLVTGNVGPARFARSYPNFNLTALTDGSLGPIPAQMLVLQGVIAQLKDDQAKGKKTKTGEDANAKDAQAENAKAEKEGKNGAILGNSISGALAGGIMNANKGWAKALCSAATIAAGSAVGAKTGEIAGEWTKDKANATDEEKNKNKYGRGMVGNLAGNFAGTSTSIALGEAICAKFTDLIKSTMIDKWPFAKYLSSILSFSLESGGVPAGQAAQFAQQLTTILDGVDAIGLETAATELQTFLVQGVGQIGQLIAAGEAAAIQPALTAMTELGAATGILSSTLSGAGDTFVAFHQFTQQLTTLNEIVGGLPDVAQEMNTGIGKVVKNVDQLASSAKDYAADTAKYGAETAEKIGRSFARRVGGVVKDGLSLFNPFFGSDGDDSGGKKTRTKHVTETHHTTATKTTHETKTQDVTKTRTKHVTETHNTTATKTAHKTKTHDVTKTSDYTTTRWKVKTKEATMITKTSQVIQTMKAVPTLGSDFNLKVSPGLKPFHISNGMTKGKILVVCRSNLTCYGAMHNSPIEYKEVKDKDFERCYRGSASCFDPKNPNQLEFFRDNKKKIGGTSCAGPRPGHDKVQCWGTPNRSKIYYKAMEVGKFLECVQNERKCD